MGCNNSLTTANDQLYTLITAGKSPIVLDTMKCYMGIKSSSDDPLIQVLIDACTQWGQKYTQRDFTDNVWSLLINCFEDEICIRRNPISSLTSVEYSVTTVFDTLVDSSVYFLKKGVQISSVNLSIGEVWPNDNIDQVQSIKITFVTEAVGPDKIDIAKLGIMQHVAYMYENRGDCGDCGQSADAAGVPAVYNMIKIANI